MQHLKKWGKRALAGLILILGITVILVVLPRTWAFLNPGKPPVGYHFLATSYLALWSGLEELIDKSPEIPDEIEEIKDIEYKVVDGKSLQMDFYRPRQSAHKPPLLVFVHGGGWKGGKRSDYMIYTTEFARRGYVTATVSYRLVKDKPYPASAEDIVDAVTWLSIHGDSLGYDADRIALIGGSAGAHLTMLAAFGWQKPGSTEENPRRAPKVKALVNIYGPVDLTGDYARNHPLVTNYLASSYEDAKDLYREASPAKYIDGSAPPTLIFHGTSDDLVPVAQGDMLKNRLDSLGVPCVYHRLLFWPHTMDMVVRVNDYFKERMAEFFREYLD